MLTDEQRDDYRQQMASLLGDLGETLDTKARIEEEEQLIRRDIQQLRETYGEDIEIEGLAQVRMSNGYTRSSYDTKEIEHAIAALVTDPRIDPDVRMAYSQRLAAARKQSDVKPSLVVQYAASNNPRKTKFRRGK